MKIQIHIKCKYELRKRPLIWKVGKNLEKYSLKNSLFSKVASSRYSRLENLALLKILFLILKVVEIYIWKSWQKYTKFENILKKGSPICATIACMKQPEYALLWQAWEKFIYFSTQ